MINIIVVIIVIFNNKKSWTHQSNTLCSRCLPAGGANLTKTACFAQKVRSNETHEKQQVEGNPP